MKYKYYETLYILSPDLPNEEYDSLAQKFSDVVDRNGGVSVKVSMWGKRALAYEIEKFDRGFFILFRYCGISSTVFELAREMRIDERVLKFQTIKLSDDENPETAKEREANAQTSDRASYDENHNFNPADNDFAGEGYEDDDIPAYSGASENEVDNDSEE